MLPSVPSSTWPARVKLSKKGETLEEARKNLLEALELFLEAASPSEIQGRLHSEVYVTRLDVALG